VATLGVALLWGLTPSAQAWELFGRCNKGSCDTTVCLPQQRVVVETAAPRVSVQETTRVARGVAPAMIGTVYMPMAFPVAGFAGIAGREVVDVNRDEDVNPLRVGHEAELQKLRYDEALARLKTHIEAKQRVLARMSSSTTCQDATTPSGDLEKRINELKDKIDRLTDRLSSVERLVIIHDRYIREQIPPKAEQATPKTP
jgi:hypothetical protein